MARPFAPALLAGDPAAAALLPPLFRDPAARARTVAAAQARRVPPALLEVLQRQTAALPPAPARTRHLDRLASGAAVVVTGQQLGLFLGPLYTVYKAATAIVLARVLEAETGRPCVPLFWLQTEDHDFAEIDHVDVPGPGEGPLRIAVADGAGRDARMAVAHRSVGADVTRALAALAAALPPGAPADEVMALLRGAWRPGVPLAQAFAGTLGALFAEDGLLILDPRHEAVARLAAPLYRRAIGEHERIAEILAARAGALRAGGFAEQVPLRRRCPLVFFHEGGPEGPRRRLERRGSAWGLAGGAATLAPAEVEGALERTPLSFSSSALLRPLVQDSLLPTAATVVGPGELAYFAQLAPLYDHFGLAVPLVVPRARFRLVPARTREQLAALGLEPADLERPREEVERLLGERVSATLPSPGGLRDAVLAAAAPHLDRLAEAAVAVDPTLARPAQRTREAIARAVTLLADKTARARVRQDDVLGRRLDAVCTVLAPGGVPQERVYGWPWAAALAGPAALRARLLAGVAPLQPSLQDIDL